ncbi:MBL fold metallo-hydrolase [Eubacteriaceae bacterium ES3]|nr:MBL fold metallo-hydrolase [Eubacteriaceae bacterium ES3]
MKGLSMGPAINLTYISNAGVLINIADVTLMVDGLCGSDGLYYSATPKAIAEKIKASEYSEEKITAALYTHSHSDHFSKMSNLDFLFYNPNSALVAGSDVINTIEADTSVIKKEVKNKFFTSNVNSSITFSDQNLVIQPLSTVHMGKEYKNVEHFSYYISINNQRILYLGDAELIPENFNHPDFTPNPVDLLIAPFPYISTFRGQKIIRDIIKPKAIAVVHLPQAQDDSLDWTKQTVKMLGRAKQPFPPTTFLDTFGKVYSFLYC